MPSTPTTRRASAVRAALALAALALFAPRSLAQDPYEACGTLVSQPTCAIAFQPDFSPGILLLTEYGGYPVGTRVHVIGMLNSCSTTCMTGTCVLFNTIELCEPCNCTPVCFGDGGGTACPCGNVGESRSGCPNSQWPEGARLTATGGASLSLDTMVLRAWRMSGDTALFFQGDGPVDLPFGDGKRCAGGAVLRLAVLGTDSSGRARHPSVGETRLAERGRVTTPGTRYYQVWYRDPESFCTPAEFNLTNAVRIDWQP